MTKARFAGCVLLGAMCLSTAQADEWKMLPFKDPSWSPDFILAVTAGELDPDVDGVDSGTAVGAQLSLNCPWFEPPKGAIRQQFNYNSFDENGLEITTLEINPRYYMGEGDLTFGVGPGLGYLWAESDAAGVDTGMWALQLGADVEYRMGALYLGAGTRYQLTQDEELGATGQEGVDNWLTSVKLGINF